jgi:formylmethanofuran dehydrogenase subunit E
MKYVIILLLFLALMIWLSWRFRRQIAVGRQVWKMLLETSRRMNQQTGSARPPEKMPAGKLVRCAKCGTWAPQNTALDFGNKVYFCSPKCMEKSVVNQ